MIFKKVKPYAAFCGGTNFVIEEVNVQSVKDDLVGEVTFKYTLRTGASVWAGEGAYTLTPENYSTWDATDKGAYEIVCAAINLELLPNARFKADEFAAAEPMAEGEAE